MYSVLNSEFFKHEIPVSKESVQFTHCITVVDNLDIIPFSLVLVKLECVLSLVESAFVLKNFNWQRWHT